MITYIKCNDFEKQFFDDIDESIFFIRNEECQHYKIKMKRKSMNSKFEKFEITFSCNECTNVEKKEFTKSNDEYNFICENCGKCFMTFKYLDTTYIEEEKSKVSTRIVDPFKQKKEENNNLIEQKLLGREEKGEDQNHSDKINSNKKIYHTPSINKEKNIRFHTPGDEIEVVQNHSDKINTNKKIYRTPSINKNENIRSPYQPYEPFLIKLIYNGRKEKVELNKLDNIDNQYYIIQEKFKFKDKKNISFQSEDLDLTKKISELKISPNYEYEIDDDSD